MNIMGKVKSSRCYLWLGNMPTSAWGADMLERWLENLLLPMAPIRYASCSLTTLGMLKESSRKKDNKKKKEHERKENNSQKHHLYIYTGQMIIGCQWCAQHLLTAILNLQFWIFPLDFTIMVQKDTGIKPCRMRNTAYTGQGFMSAFRKMCFENSVSLKLNPVIKKLFSQFLS